VKVDDIKKADGFDNFFDEYSLEKVQNKLILKKKVYKREKI
jgi:hypothetical protein